MKTKTSAVAKTSTKTKAKTSEETSVKVAAKAKTKTSGVAIVDQKMDKIIKTVKSEEKGKKAYLFMYFRSTVLVR